VLAIQQTSPLPAPPSASVFSHSISLKFLGLPYVAGSPEDDYEFAPVKTVQALSALPASRTHRYKPPNEFLSALRELDPLFETTG